MSSNHLLNILPFQSNPLAELRKRNLTLAGFVVMLSRCVTLISLLLMSTIGDPSAELIRLAEVGRELPQWRGSARLLRLATWATVQ